jgi:hypothetical protein
MIVEAPDTARRRVARQVLQPKPIGGSAKRLLSAQLSVLEAIAPRTVRAIMERDTIAAGEAFEYESRHPLPLDWSQQIDYIIVRAYTRAELPTDDSIAAEVTSAGLPETTTAAIKKRRQRKELFGRNPGPRPKS